MRGGLTGINRRDALAAVAVVGLGLFGITEALGYRLGEMRNIGPGAFPLIVSVLILIAGVLIGFESIFKRHHDGEYPAPYAPNYRVLLFVMASLLSFAAVTPMFGAVPGIVVCVFLSAQADGSLRLWQTAILAALIAGFCALVFVVLLNLPLELFVW